MGIEVLLLTRNSDKLSAAQKAFSKFGIKVSQTSKEFAEIQAGSSIEIAEFAVSEAIKEFNLPVIREDHSLFIHALGCFPGPYTNYFDKKMPVELLLKILSNFEDRTAHMELAAAMKCPDGDYFKSVYTVPLKLSNTVNGTNGNWNKILMLRDEEKTFAEESESSRTDVWAKNYIELAKKLCDKYG